MPVAATALLAMPGELAVALLVGTALLKVPEVVEETSEVIEEPPEPGDKLNRVVEVTPRIVVDEASDELLFVRVAFLQI